MGLFFFSRKRVMRAALLLCALLAAPVAVQKNAHRRNQKAAVHYPTEQHLGCIRVAQQNATLYQIIAKMVPASLARSARTSTRCCKRIHSSQVQRSKSRMDMVERKFVPPPQAAPPARTFPWTNLACTPASLNQ